MGTCNGSARPVQDGVGVGSALGNTSIASAVGGTPRWRMPERRGGSQVLVAGGSWFMNHIGLASWNPVAPADHHQRDTSVLSMCPLPPAAEAMVLLGSGGARLVVVLGETDQLPLIFGVGAESISIHSRDAVSSSTSIALSDRNRS